MAAGKSSGSIEVVWQVTKAYSKVLRSSHVFRPGVGHEQVHGPAGDAADIFAAFELQGAEKGFRQQGQIKGPLPQRWDGHWDDIDAIGEVLAEGAIKLPLFYRLLF